MFNKKPTEFMVICVRMIHNWRFRVHPYYINIKTKKIRETKEELIFLKYSTLEKTLQEAGFMKCARHEEDDPEILECWV